MGVLPPAHLGQALRRLQDGRGSGKAAVRYSNRGVNWKGETVVCTVRLARPIVDFIDNHLDDEMANRSECLQEAAFLWCEIEEREHG